MIIMDKSGCNIEECKKLFHDVREVSDGCRKTEFCKRKLYLNIICLFYSYNTNFIFISRIFKQIFLYHFNITQNYTINITHAILHNIAQISLNEDV